MLSTTVGMNINPLKRSASSAKAELKSLNRALGAQSKAFKGAGMDAEQLAGREKMLTKAIDAQEDQVKQKKAAYERAKGAVTDMSQATAKERNAIERAKGAYSEAQFTLQKYKNNLQTTATQQIRMKNSTAGLDSEMSEMRLTTSRAVSMFKRMGNETGALRAQYKGLGNQINIHGRKLDMEKNSLKEIRQQMGATSNEYKEQRQVVDRLTDEHAQLIGKQNAVATSMNKVKGATRGATRDYKKLGDQWRSVGQGMQGVGRSMTAAVTLPVSLAIGGAIKATVGWEDALSNVAKTTNAGSGQMKKYGASIRDMAREMPESQSTLANTMAVAAQLGIKGGKDLEKFTKVATQMGVATDMSAEEASNAMAKFANATGKPDSDFNKLGSTVVQLGKLLPTY